MMPSQIIVVIDQINSVIGDPVAMRTIMNRWSRSRGPNPRAIMPSINFGPRKSLTELRPRHLQWVEEVGCYLNYDRDEWRDFFLDSYHRLFGPLRKSKVLEVPSDQLRKEFMVSRLLDLIETRRAEYQDEWTRYGKPPHFFHPDDCPKTKAAIKRPC